MQPQPTSKVTAVSGVLSTWQQCPPRWLHGGGTADVVDTSLPVVCQFMPAVTGAQVWVWVPQILLRIRSQSRHPDGLHNAARRWHKLALILWIPTFIQYSNWKHTPSTELSAHIYPWVIAWPRMKHHSTESTYMRTSAGLVSLEVPYNTMWAPPNSCMYHESLQNQLFAKRCHLYWALWHTHQSFVLHDPLHAQEEVHHHFDNGLLPRLPASLLPLIISNLHACVQASMFSEYPTSPVYICSRVPKCNSWPSSHLSFVHLQSLCMVLATWDSSVQVTQRTWILMIMNMNINATTCTVWLQNF